MSSGIPTASQLVRNADAGEDWLRRYRDLVKPELKDEKLDDWARNVLRTWSTDSPGSSYGELIELLFLTPGERQREIERLCSGKIPGFGYTVLSSLMCLPGGAFSAVLTTNFDDLIAESFFRFQLERPMVINHDSLAPFIRPTHTRPLLIKLHGDHRLAPRNTAGETEVLDRTVAERVSTVLHDRGLVFIGYGGNDESILRMLESLPEESLPYGVYWVSHHEPRGLFRSWLEQRDAIWVEGRDFDLLMLLVKRSFEFADPTDGPIQQVLIQYHAAQKQLVEKLVTQSPESNDHITAMSWMISVLGNDIVQKAPELVEEFFKQSLERDPNNSSVILNYANFAATTKKDAALASQLYKKALLLSPNDPDTLGDFALFLDTSGSDSDNAEGSYRKAIDADPAHANNLCNFAQFIAYTRGDNVEAEKLFRRCIEAKSRTARHLRAFARFLEHRLHKYDDAEAVYKEALEAAPGDVVIISDYALFLDIRREEFDEAERLYRKACDSEGRSADGMGNYAHFLWMRRGDHDNAQKWFIRALEEDPHHANNLGNYGLFLLTVRLDRGRAEEYYRRAVAETPLHVGHALNLAACLLAEGSDGKEAIEWLERALNAEPKNGRALSMHAKMREESGVPAEEVEALYKKAMEGDSPYVPGIANYARFRAMVLHDEAGAADLIRRCIELEPKKYSHVLWLGQMLMRDKSKVDQAEQCLQKALQMSEGKCAECFAAYALFLKGLHRDEKQVEQMFERALEVDPGYFACHCWYGIFLQQRRRDLDAAEHHYRVAMEGGEIETLYLCNLGQVVLARGAAVEGMGLIASVREQLVGVKEGPLSLECELYSFLHGPKEDRTESLRRLRTLLERGIRSQNWDFSANVKRAIDVERHPDAHWLERLAFVCNSTAEIKSLARWKRWKDAV